MVTMETNTNNHLHHLNHHYHRRFNIANDCRRPITQTTISLVTEISVLKSRSYDDNNNKIIIIISIQC